MSPGWRGRALRVQPVAESAPLTPALLLTAIFIGGLDQTVVASLLPSIVREFSVPLDRLDEAAWAVTLYLGCYACVLPFAGRVIDHGGRRALHAGALGLFLAGSIGCAAAGSLGPLVAARAVQALGAGALVPLALADAAQHPVADRRLAGMGVTMAVAEGGAVLGPLYGAAVLLFADWRWAFWLNVPVAAVLLLAACRDIGKPRDLSRSIRDGASLSLMFATAAIGILVVGISREAARLAAWLPWVSGAASMLLFALASWAARGGVGEVAGSTRVRAGLLAHLFLGVALITPLVLVPVWASTLLDRPAHEAALTLLRLTLAIPPCALAGAVIAPRVGRAVVAGSGFLLVAAGLLMMARWSVETNDAGMTPALILAGCGFGLLLAPTTEALLDLSTSAAVATALGWATAARVVGMAVGLAGMTAWGLERLAERLAALPLPLPQAGEGAADLARRVELYRQAAVGVGVEIFGALFAVGALSAIMGACAVLIAIRSQGALVPARIHEEHALHIGRGEA